MNVLCDTQALLCWLDDRLPDRAAQAIDRADVAHVSVATLWEIAIKRSIGKLDAPDDLLEQLDRHGFSLLNISPTHALGVGDLERHHGDPFDRLLVVQALDLGVPIVSGDAVLRAYGATTVW